MRERETEGGREWEGEDERERQREGEREGETREMSEDEGSVVLTLSGNSKCPLVILDNNISWEKSVYVCMYV